MSLPPLPAPSRGDDPGEPSTGKPRIGVDTTEAELLAFLVAGKKVLEIGTGVGRSAIAMSSTAHSVDSVDIDDWVHTNIAPALRADHHVRVHHRIPSGLCWDVVFIDGEHSDKALTADIATAEACCPVGLHIVHDAIQMRATLDGSWTIINTKYGLGIRYYGWE